MEFLNIVLASVPTWLISFMTIGITVYWYLTKHYNHWKRVGIPYVPPIPIFGSTLEHFTKNMPDVDVERHKSKGHVYGLYEGRNPILTVADPDVLRDILVKDFHYFPERRNFRVGLPLWDSMLINIHGKDWERIRPVITPAFSTGKVKKMIGIFADSAKTLTTNLKAVAEEGKPADMKRLYGAFTMDVIASCAFAIKLDSYNNPDNPFIVAARNAFRNPFPWRNALFILFPGIMQFLGIPLFPLSSVKFFEKATSKIVEERKRSKQRGNDLLQLLTDAVERNWGKDDEDEDVSENPEIKQMGHEEDNEQLFKSYKSSHILTNTELVANCVVFFFAGYDGPSSTLAYIAYELALNSDIQDRLIAEIDETIREKGELNYEALCEMKYMDKIISETFRKYPILFRNERVAAEDYEIQYHDVKIAVPKGMLISVPIYAIHHDPNNYPDPEKYDPDRFSQEQKSKRHPYAYIPFGAGPRNCVAMRYALMQIKVCLATVFSQYRFSTCSETQIPLQFMNGQRMLQPKHVVLKVETRRDTHKL